MPPATPRQVQQEVRRLTGRGLLAAGYFLKSRVQEAVSVPAPRERRVSGARSRNPGTIYYVATTPATPGAPPRKLSGRGRASIALDFDSEDSVVRVGTNIPYMGRHERRDHPFLRPTLQQYANAIGAIVGGRVRLG